MPARSMLLLAPPHPVELALKELGSNLRTARLRRNLTIEDGRRTWQAISQRRDLCSPAWALDPLADMQSLADPAPDQEGQVLARSKARDRARRGEALDNDF